MKPDYEKFISDFARKALSGNQSVYHNLVKLLYDMDHPILDEMDFNSGGLQIIRNIIQPLSSLIIEPPRVRVHIQSITWENESGKPSKAVGPAEMWFDQMYLGYYRDGVRHRLEGPAIVDISNKSLTYFINGKPRTHEKGPFKVQMLGGNVTLTYVMGERMLNMGSQIHDDGFLKEDDGYEPIYTEEPGDQVIVTRNFIDIEGVGKSEPSEEDLKNLAQWSGKLKFELEEGRQYLKSYLNKFV